MNMLTQQTTLKTLLMNAVRLVIFIPVSLAGNAGVLAVERSNDWQNQRLLQPSATQLTNERRGQVFIYDGLNERVVERAMDEHFERIDSMMFVNVKAGNNSTGSSAGDGPDEVDDDGCE